MVTKKKKKKQLLAQISNIPKSKGIKRNTTIKGRKKYTSIQKNHTEYSTPPFPIRNNHFYVNRRRIHIKKNTLLRNILANIKPIDDINHEIYSDSQELNLDQKKTEYEKASLILEKCLKSDPILENFLLDLTKIESYSGKCKKIHNFIYQDRNNNMYLLQILSDINIKKKSYKQYSKLVDHSLISFNPYIEKILFHGHDKNTMYQLSSIEKGRKLKFVYFMSNVPKEIQPIFYRDIYYALKELYKYQFNDIKIENNNLFFIQGTCGYHKIIMGNYNNIFFEKHTTDSNLLITNASEYHLEELDKLISKQTEDLCIESKYNLRVAENTKRAFDFMNENLFYQSTEYLSSLIDIENHSSFLLSEMMKLALGNKYYKKYFIQLLDSHRTSESKQNKMYDKYIYFIKNLSYDIESQKNTESIYEYYYFRVKIEDFYYLQKNNDESTLLKEINNSLLLSSKEKTILEGRIEYHKGNFEKSLSMYNSVKGANTIGNITPLIDEIINTNTAMNMHLFTKEFKITRNYENDNTKNT